MNIERLLADDQARDLLALTGELAARELAPVAGEHEATGTFPREVFRTLGKAGLLSLPYPEQFGGGGQPYEVYLQVLEELARAWVSVAVGVSVHALACFPLASFGTPQQRERFLPELLGGDLLGAYCLSESHAGSDPSAMTTRAEGAGSGYVLTGTKAWITHGGQADVYTTFARTREGPDGVSCFLIEAGSAGLTFGVPERKMGLNGSTTSSAILDGVAVDPERRIGAEGQGLPMALAALDSGRLGIAACAVGLAQAALDVAVDYARQRVQFGRRIIDHQGLGFLLADMEAAVHSSRATVLDAARRKDAGREFSRAASIAKLVASDAAMKVTTDAVQVLGGAGYTRDFPVERYLREAKVMQIFEGTNQIQRLVISRSLSR
jgi:alkylation response protein AidB-like acyl-CoA dehydrogenase